MDRREFFRRSAAGTVATLALGAVPSTLFAQRAARSLVVYKSPTCGCCKAWIAYMQKNGWTVTAHDVPDIQAIKTQMNVPAEMQSCHTAIVGKYVVEGHVPADLVSKLVAEHPANIAGIAVPGMITGTPGMEVSGVPADAYRVMAYDARGKSWVYANR